MILELQIINEKHSTFLVIGKNCKYNTNKVSHYAYLETVLNNLWIKDEI